MSFKHNAFLKRCVCVRLCGSRSPPTRRTIQTSCLEFYCLCLRRVSQDQSKRLCGGHHVGDWRNAGRYVDNGTYSRALGRYSASDAGRIALLGRTSFVAGTATTTKYRPEEEIMLQPCSRSVCGWMMKCARCFGSCLGSHGCVTAHPDKVVTETFSLVSSGPYFKMFSTGFTRVAKLRAQFESESADEDVPPRGSGWRGIDLMMVVLAIGRWSVQVRKDPISLAWRAVAELYLEFACREGSPELLMKLAFLVCWLVGWSVGRSVGWLVGCVYPVAVDTPALDPCPGHPCSGHPCPGPPATDHPKFRVFFPLPTFFFLKFPGLSWNRGGLFERFHY